MITYLSEKLIIKVRVKALGSSHPSPLMDLTFGLKIRRDLEDRFLKLGELFC